jgi:hypothetical protein
MPRKVDPRRCEDGYEKSWDPVLLDDSALSEENRRANDFGSPANSSGNLTPFSKGGQSVEFEVLAAVKVAFLVEMVVDRSVDRGELL